MYEEMLKSKEKDVLKRVKNETLKNNAGGMTTHEKVKMLSKSKAEHK